MRGGFVLFHLDSLCAFVDCLRRLLGSRHCISAGLFDDSIVIDASIAELDDIRCAFVL